MSANASTFGFTGFGARAPEQAICCDGLVEGAGLQLSHWGGNTTPRELKADTSVEIAMRYVETGGASGRLVVNNHFDTDGVLAVWTLLEPERALRHRDVLVAAAEAGDFEEWPADERDVWLDAAIATLARGSEDEAAYRRVLAALAALVEGLEQHRDLWGDAWHELGREEARAERELGVEQHGSIALFRHARADELPGAVLSRRAPADARRWLIALDQGAGLFRYRYERPRWAWADSGKRPVIANPDRKAIVRALGPSWSVAASGMTAIAQTADPVRDTPQAILDALAAVDAA